MVYLQLQWVVHIGILTAWFNVIVKTAAFGAQLQIDTDRPSQQLEQEKQRTSKAWTTKTVSSHT